MGHPTLDRRTATIINVVAVLTIVILIFYKITVNSENNITKEIEILEKPWKIVKLQPSND